MTHLAKPTVTAAAKLTPEQEAKFIVDMNKLIDKYSRDMSIDTFATATGKLVQDQWGAHLTQRFTNNFVLAVKEASETEKSTTSSADPHFRSPLTEREISKATMGINMILNSQKDKVDLESFADIIKKVVYQQWDKSEMPKFVKMLLNP